MLLLLSVLLPSASFLAWRCLVWRQEGISIRGAVTSDDCTCHVSLILPPWCGLQYPCCVRIPFLTSDDVTLMMQPVTTCVGVAEAGDRMSSWILHVSCLYRQLCTRGLDSFALSAAPRFLQTCICAVCATNPAA